MRLGTKKKQKNKHLDRREKRETKGQGGDRRNNRGVRAGPADGNLFFFLHTGEMFLFASPAIFKCTGSENGGRVGVAKKSHRSPRGGVATWRDLSYASRQRKEGTEWVERSPGGTEGSRLKRPRPCSGKGRDVSGPGGDDLPPHCLDCRRFQSVSTGPHGPAAANPAPPDFGWFVPGRVYRGRDHGQQAGGPAKPGPRNHDRV